MRLSVAQLFFSEARPGQPEFHLLTLEGQGQSWLALLATALMAWSNWTKIGKPTRSNSYKAVYCLLCFNSLVFAQPIPLSH